MSRKNTGDTFTATDGHDYKVLADNTTVTLWFLANGGVGSVTITDTVTDSNAFSYTVVQVGDVDANKLVVANIMSSTLEEIHLPSTVTAIGKNAFRTCNTLTTITASGVTVIHSTALSSCNALTSVLTPAVTEVSSIAFASCNLLEYISLPSITSIGDQAFGSCIALKGLYVGEKGENDVTITGDPFYNVGPTTGTPFTIYYASGAVWPATINKGSQDTPCVEYAPSATISSNTISPTSGSPVTLTASLTPAGIATTYRFYYGTEALGTDVQETNTYEISSFTASNNGSYTVQITDGFGSVTTSAAISITAVDPRLTAGTLFTASDGHQYKVLADNTTVTLWELANGGVGDVTLSETVNDQNGTAYTLYEVGSLPSQQVSGVGTSVGTSLTSITLPSTVWRIGRFAFGGPNTGSAVTTLTRVVAPGVTYLGDSSFRFCIALESVVMPALQTIERLVFLNCSSIRNLYLPNVTSVGMEAFKACSNLTNLYFAQNYSSSMFTLSSGIGPFVGSSNSITIYRAASATNWPASLTFAETSTTTREIPVIEYAPSATLGASSTAPLVGTSVTLTASFSPAGLAASYRFYRSGNALGESAQSANTYDIASFYTSNDGNYTVDVTDVFGLTVSSSQVAIAVATPPPVITVQPVGGNMTGGSYTATVTATNATSYQLMKYNPTPGMIGYASASAVSTSPSFTITQAGTYRIKVYGGSSGSILSVNSNNFTVTNIVAPTITSQPVNGSMTVGGTAPTLSVTATSDNLSYQWHTQWYTGSGGLVTGAIVGATSSTYTPSITSAGSYSYYVVVSNVAGTVQSNTVTITATAASPPVITTQPASSGYMFTGVSTYTLTVVATGATSYQWYTGTGGPIAGATSASYAVSATTPATLSFYVVVTNAAGSVTSSTATVNAIAYGSPTGITPNNFERLNLSTTTATPIGSNGRDYSAIAATPSGSGASRSATINAGTVAGVATPVLTYSNIPSSIASVQAAVSTPKRNNNSGKMELYINTVMKDGAGNVVSDFSATGGITITFPCPASLLDGATGTPNFKLYEIDDNTNVRTEIPASNITYNPTTGLLSVTVQHFSEKMIENNSSSNVVCFPAGERVLTTTGYRAVEDLRRGDRLVTADGRSVPAVVYRMSVPYATEKTAPYLIPAHTFGHRSPPADIRLSPQHAFQIGKGLWQIPAAAARTHSAVRQYGVGEPITYYHLELPNYFTDNIVMEGGAVVESFAYRQVPRGARIYTYNVARDAYTRPRSVKDVIRKTA